MAASHTSSQRSRKERDGTFPPNKRPKMDQDAHSPNFNKFCRDIITRIQNLERRVEENEEKICNIQTKLNEEDRACGLSELRANFESSKDELDRIEVMLNNLHLGLAKNDSIAESLAQEVKQLEEENSKLKEKISLHESKIQKLEKENLELEVRVKALEKNVGELEAKLEKQRPDAVTVAILNLGQFFIMAQLKMYELVFQCKANPKFAWNYKLSDLLNEIKDKPDAKKMWEKLKKRIKWNRKLESTMISICEYRNQAAHPTSMNVARLQDDVRLLDEEGFFKTPDDALSRENTEALIGIFKRLQELKDL